MISDRFLNGEILENRYFDAFFVDKDGIEIGITYHYPGDGKNLLREWMDHSAVYYERNN